MRRTFARFVGTLALSWGLSATAWGQLPPPPPGPPGPAAPTPLPAPTPTPPNGPAPNAAPTPAPPAGNITVTTPAAPAPGNGGTCGSCSPGSILSGGCFKGFGGLFPSGCGGLFPSGCGSGGTWIAGGGAYFMAPVYNSNPAFATSKVAGPGATVTGQQNFGTKISVAPLAFIGYTWDNGWGVRFRWFQITNNNSAGVTLSGSPQETRVADAGGQFFQGSNTGSVVAANSHLYLQAYDLEATYLTKLGQWTLLGSAGARYAQISQGYAYSLTDPVSALNNVSSGASHTFNGFGPTASFEGHYRCGCSDFGLYAMGRGSILFGSGSVSSYLTGNTFFNTDGATFATPFSVNGSERETSVIPVGELEAGGEWFHSFGRLRVFAQVGVVGQIWWGAGSPSQGIYLNGPQNTTPTTPANLGFIGGVARVGILF